MGYTRLVDTSSATFQHFIWFFSHIEVYVILVFYASALMIWGYALRKTFITKERQKIYGIIFAFYTVFIVFYILFTLNQIYDATIPRRVIDFES